MRAAGDEDTSYTDLIKDLVRSYIRRERTIIVATISCKDDLNNQVRCSSSLAGSSRGLGAGGGARAGPFAVLAVWELIKVMLAGPARATNLSPLGPSWHHW